MGRRMKRHLMRTKRSFHLEAIHYLGPSPALGRLEHNHRPARAREVAMNTSFPLNLLDLFYCGVKRRGHGLVHQLGFATLDEIWRPAVAAEQLLQFVARDSSE